MTTTLTPPPAASRAAALAEYAEATAAVSRMEAEWDARYPSDHVDRLPEAFRSHYFAALGRRDRAGLAVPPCLRDTITTPTGA